MRLPDLRRLGGLLDRLLRPGQAAENARDAATDAADGVRHRERIDREVDALTDEDNPPRER